MGAGLIRYKSDGTEARSFFRWCHNRIRANKNVILGVVGSTGSGKSYSCLRIAEVNNKHYLKRKKQWDVKNCCRNTSEFLNRLNSGELRKGEVIIFEEVGVNIGARDFQTRMNKIINYIFQTFRTDNLIVLLNLPDIRMLDVNTQRILHGIVTTQGIDLEKEKSYIQLKIKQHNFQNHKDYWKFMRIAKKGKVTKIKKFELSKPSDEITIPYEARRKEYTDNLKKDVSLEVNMQERNAQLKLSGGNGRAFTDRQKQIHDLWHGGMKKFMDIAKEVGADQSLISRATQSMDKKFPNWREKPIY